MSTGEWLWREPYRHTDGALGSVTVSSPVDGLQSTAAPPSTG